MLPTRQPPGLRHRRIGALRITTLNDGVIEAGFDWLTRIAPPEAAAQRLAIAGMHLDFPAFGHVVRAGEGYSFVPDIWSPTP